MKYKNIALLLLALQSAPCLFAAAADEDIQIPAEETQEEKEAKIKEEERIKAEDLEFFGSDSSSDSAPDEDKVITEEEKTQILAAADKLNEKTKTIRAKIIPIRMKQNNATEKEKLTLAELKLEEAELYYEFARNKFPSVQALTEEEETAWDTAYTEKKKPHDSKREQYLRSVTQKDYKMEKQNYRKMYKELVNIQKKQEIKPQEPKYNKKRTAAEDVQLPAQPNKPKWENVSLEEQIAIDIEKAEKKEAADKEADKNKGNIISRNPKTSLGIGGVIATLAAARTEYHNYKNTVLAGKTPMSFTAFIIDAVKTPSKPKAFMLLFGGTLLLEVALGLNGLRNS